MPERAVSARQRIRERARRANLRLVEDTPELSRMSVEEAQRRNQVEFARQFDPTAALPEEVQLRLVGEGAAHGEFPVEWSAVAPRFRDALAEFWTAKGPLQLRLVGFSAGSTVMHFVPDHVDAMAVADAGPVVVDQTALGDAAERLARVLDRAGAGGDLRPWSSHLHEVERLASELSKHDLNADLTYLGGAGRVVRARLDEAVRERLASLQETHEVTEIRTVNGRITQLAENGQVRVKAGTARNARVSEVHVRDKAKLRGLRIGDQVHWNVTAIRSVDELGRGQEERLEYQSAAAPPVDSDPLAWA